MSDTNKEKPCLVELRRLYAVYKKYLEIVNLYNTIYADCKVGIDQALDFTTAKIQVDVISNEMRHVAKFHCTCSDGSCIEFYNDKICAKP